jgi:hypothetical protein
MRTNAPCVAAYVVGCLLSGATAGCGNASNPILSPISEQAVDRHQQAIRYAQELAGKNQRAEKKAMGRIARSAQRP